MTSCYGLPDLQVVQHASGSKAVFDVNQASLGAMRQIWPRYNNCTLQRLVETLCRIRVHRSILRSRAELMLAPIPHRVGTIAARPPYPGSNSVAYGENARTQSRTALRGNVG